MRSPSVAFALLFVGSAACVDKGDEGMFVLNNSAPSGTMCVFTGSPSQPFIAGGTIAANAPTGYFITPLVQSRITATTDQILERTIHLEGANIALSAVGTNGKLMQTATYTTLFSGSVMPLGTANVGFEVIPQSSTAVSADTELVAAITVFGSLGGGRIEAEPFNYPILVYVPQPCGMTLPSMGGNPCNAYQDGPACCSMAGTTVCASP